MFESSRDLFQRLLSQLSHSVTSVADRPEVVVNLSRLSAAEPSPMTLLVVEVLPAQDQEGRGAGQVQGSLQAGGDTFSEEQDGEREASAGATKGREQATSGLGCEQTFLRRDTK